MACGIRPQAYVHNPMEWVDPLGLSGFFTKTIFNAPSGNTHNFYMQNIDWDLPVNTRGGVKTNLELASQGRSPFVVKNDKYSQVNLHHSKQNANGSLFELSADTHQKNYGTNALHPHLPNAHPINPVNRDVFDADREAYWQARAKHEKIRRSEFETSKGCG